MKKSHSGFTLIELLVVVAIIGILSAMILASLGTVRKRAQDSRIKGEMKQMQVQAEIYYSSSTGGGYGTAGTCEEGLYTAEHSAGGLSRLITSIKSILGDTADIKCTATGGQWAFSAPLLLSGEWCVDSDGYSGPGSALSGACEITP